MNRLKVTLLLLVFAFSLVQLNAQTDSITPVRDSLSSTAIDTVIPPKKRDLSEFDFKKSRSYILGGISVKGNQQFSEQSIRVFSNLTVGEEIKIPGDKLTAAIKKLWGSKLFSNVDVYVTNIDGNTIYLEFDVNELSKISEVTFEGIKKTKAEEFQKETDFKRGAMLTENLITTTKNYIKNKYVEKGFLNAKVSISTKVDTTHNNAEKALIVIDKGDRVKIKNLRFHGNEKFTDKRLKKYLKKTKEKNFFHIFKPSKYREEEYNADLERLVEKYQEKGFRDAHIIKDSISWNDDNTINLDINLIEGNKYYFGDIKFIGNSFFTDEELANFLGLEKGDTYNGKLLNDRVSGDGSPDSQDITNTYLNKGFLFSRVVPVETRVQNDTIDIEIRIREDEQATIRKVTLVGNEITNDHVIFRNIRTRPGDLFSREKIIRTIREVGQLPFIDPEAIVPDIKDNYQDKTVDIEYTVAKKGASQIELQGGFGGKTFIGTLGLSFSNFAIKDLFNKKAYTPVPRGDGQSIALRAQASRFSNSYSLSFTEPWLGGKKPRSLSFSIYSSSQFNYNYATNDVDKNQKLNILGASIGIGQNLKWPDDYFTLSAQISYQRYNLNNFFLNTFGFNNGISNNLSLGLNFGRSSAGYNPIFPTYGSKFNIGAKITPPYSLFNKRSDEYYADLDSKDRFKWLEYYKLNFSGEWYSYLSGKPGSELVLVTGAEMGFLGAYNNKLGVSPFERFYVGGDGLGTGNFDGRTTVGLRGYENNSLSSNSGGTIFNKFSAEVRYPITLKPAASIYALGFLEAGNSYDGFVNYEPFNLKRSAGFGIRVFMPAFGLLGIDFGYGFDDMPGVPGTPSGWQTHFKIGQQF
ncbi:outer membrane protein assembly factor BamA [Flavobacteriaceae bacterium F08102]|nr:outer membrane protein assembly factor BamA [Flavobacteriaceae bacterium F08102]